jgi:hypothetical protein
MTLLALSTSHAAPFDVSLPFSGRTRTLTTIFSAIASSSSSSSSSSSAFRRDVVARFRFRREIRVDAGGGGAVAMRPSRSFTSQTASCKAS